MKINDRLYRISQSIIGSECSVQRISYYVTTEIFKQTHGTLIKLKAKLLDNLLNLIWDKADKEFPGILECKCAERCIRTFKISYMMRGYKRHTQLDPSRVKDVKDTIRNKITPYHTSLMKIVGDPYKTNINNKY